MPTTTEPQKHQPMEMANGARDATRPPTAVVDKQPISEPLPTVDHQQPLNLRGGGMNLGCDCCGGSCSFHKHCC